MTRVPDEQFRVPRDLAVTETPIRRVLVLGQCLMAGWPDVLRAIRPETECDYYVINNFQTLPEAPPRPAEDYDFQVLQLPLRSVLPDSAFFRLSYDEPHSYRAAFEACCERITQFLHDAMRWNREKGLTTFVVNFATPQQNPMGRLLPRYDLRNLVYFVEKLNEHLAGELSSYAGAHLFDFDALVATFGRKYFQDDALAHINHGAALADFGAEASFERLEPIPGVDGVYESRVFDYLKQAWIELLAMYKTIAQTDMVKLVVVDIDDTLWRGVAAERDGGGGDRIEGWPLGLAEALGHLKRRGVLLALLSKNEASLVEPIFRQTFEGRLSLDDFAARRINWRPKAENLEEMLREINVLPRSVVYIDDNPAERAAIAAAFPDVRTLPGNPLLWRRILLWSPETQVASISKESAARTAMVQAQAEREASRRRLTRADFLVALDLKVALRRLAHEEEPGFARALELLNKSNQFNTTGRRWSARELQAALQAPRAVYVFDVSDRYTHYGLVGVAILERGRIDQFVMSCRVLGMDVEQAVVAQLARGIANGGEETMTAALAETELNLAVRDLWARCGFEAVEGGWRRSLSPLPESPPHVSLSFAESPRLSQMAS